MPSAGKLANRVRFEKRGPDTNGDPLGDWEDLFTVWAEVIWLRGGEGVVASRLEGNQPAVLTIRDSTQARTLSAAHRAVAVSGRDVISGQVFNLISVAPSRDRGMIDVLGSVGGAAG